MSYSEISYPAPYLADSAEFGFATPLNATRPGGLGGGLGGGGGAAVNASSYAWNTIYLLLLGLLVEMGRKFCQWLIQRISFQYTITAQFTEGDPAYEWIILFLTDAQVWKGSREFRVTATSSKRKWAVNPDQHSCSAAGSTIASLFSWASLISFWNNLPLVGDTSRTASFHLDEKARLLTEGKEGTRDTPHAEYVPTYEAPQLFRWKGYWVEIRRTGCRMVYNPVMGHQPTSLLFLTIYAHDINILSAFVEEARQGYVKTNRPHVVVHIADQFSYGPVFTWTNAKSKARRPLNSIILQEGVINSLVDDVKEFMETEDWYVKAGIPHRRGYLLYGPPGTGKTSTIYAIAGELGLEVFSLSLASSFMDDSCLQRAVSAVPKKSILLIEDIDCAFPSPRDPSDNPSSDDVHHDSLVRTYTHSGGMAALRPLMRGKSRVTLSGLLNVLDGIGSEEGKIFFATTNHVEHLDPALMRPGRIDKKVQYKLATPAQAEALFLRFYPEEMLKNGLFEGEQHQSSSSPASDSKAPPPPRPTPDAFDASIRALAARFRAAIPAHEFSTAELQGYLLTRKTSPARAADGIAGWVESETTERQARKAREEARIEERKKAAEKPGVATMTTTTTNATSAPSPTAFAGSFGHAIAIAAAAAASHPPSTSGAPSSPPPPPPPPVPAPMYTESATVPSVDVSLSY